MALDDFQAVPPPPSNRTLTTAVDGQGTVQLSPAGGSYPQGTSVQATAVPAGGKWAFVCWSGALTGSTNPASVVMDADKTVTAIFRVPGDVTGEGDVDVVDLLYFVDAFGSVSGDANYDVWCDFNRDDGVDVVDLLTLVENFGTIGGQ